MMATLQKNHTYTYGIVYLLFLLLCVGILVFLPTLPWIALCVFVIGGFGINWVYGNFLKVPKSGHILSSAFSPLGFFYLLGYDPNLLGALKIMEETVYLYKNNLKLFAEYCLAFFVLSFTFVSFVTYLEIYDILTGSVSGVLLGIKLLLNLAFPILGFILMIAFTRVIAMRLINAEPGHMSKEIHDGMKLFWPAIFVYLAISLLATIVFILTSFMSGIFLPLLILVLAPFLWIFFAPFAVVIDNVHGLNAFRLSIQLIKNHGWEVLWRLAIPLGVFTGIVYFVVLTTDTIAQYLLIDIIAGESPLAILVNNLHALIDTFVYTFTAPLTVFIPPTILYFVLKEKLSTKK
ncbi:hypothetical protein H6758_03225 [Candidatus Nomurabacteria bacterium]|nr:hypothetical protein [Candidatus Nomurabacteria bacterium]